MRDGMTSRRLSLLIRRDTQADKVLGYESFEEYGKKRFGYEKSRLYQLTNAAEVEQSLNSTIVEKPIKESHLRPLTAIPEAERQAIWDEANRKAEEDDSNLDDMPAVRNSYFNQGRNYCLDT